MGSVEGQKEKHQTGVHHPPHAIRQVKALRLHLKALDMRMKATRASLHTSSQALTGARCLVPGSEQLSQPQVVRHTEC